MINDPKDLKALADRILSTPFSGRRRLVAVAGAPASGKSTLAQDLAAQLTSSGHKAQVVPMDGFHLDNSLLIDMGLFARKGAPASFDAEGFVRLVQALRSEARVYYPLFDRARDLSIAGAGFADETCQTAVVEGNYLLLRADPWSQLADLWDHSIYIDVPLPELETRLVRRWLKHGLSTSAAFERAQKNDLPNAACVAQNSIPASEVMRWTG